MKGDLEVVLEAAKQKGCALIHASSALCNGGLAEEAAQGNHRAVQMLDPKKARFARKGAHGAHRAPWAHGALGPHGPYGALGPRLGGVMGPMGP